MQIVDIGEYRNRAAEKHRARILELQEMVVPNLVEDEDGDWAAVDEKALEDVEDWMRMFGLEAELITKADDFMRVWHAIQADYGVTLVQFMERRASFDSSLKSKIPELVAYFEAIVGADFERVREIAYKHKITEKLLAEETPPLVYDAWSKK